MPPCRRGGAAEAHCIIFALVSDDPMLSFRYVMRRLGRRLRCRWCGKKKGEERRVYVKGFLQRSEATDVVDPEDLATVPLNRATIHNSRVVSIACIDMGEIVMGLGFVFEVLRYPPSEENPFWTLSYSVWNDLDEIKLLWRKCFTDVAAFFYVIDAADVKWMGLAKAELHKFFNMRRTVPFPSYFLVIFLNNSVGREAMRVDQVEDFLGLNSRNCLGYLIQPIHKRNRKGFKAAGTWLLDKLVKNADQTIDIYPDQVLRARASFIGVPAGPIHTFALEHSNTAHPEHTRKSGSAEGKDKPSGAEDKPAQADSAQPESKRNSNPSSELPT